MPDSLSRLVGLSARYDTRTVLKAIDLDLPEGKVIAFCGPNGSGKSTALRLMRGLHPAAAGTAEVAGRPIADWNPRDLAREVAMLSQSPNAPADLTVGDLVMLGRFPHRGRFAAPSAIDRAACARALAATETADLAARGIGQLSGGQLQRAWIAMTLAQDAPRIFLDEPTNHLDIAHALEILDLIRRLNRDEGRSFVIVLHDLNMAMRYAHHVVLFSDGRIAAQGDTAEVLTRQRIAQVFDIDVTLLRHDGLDTPIVVPVSRRPEKGPARHAAE